MDDAERAWLREKLYEHAAELGGQKAHQRAQDEAIGNIRIEVRDGFIAMRNELTSHYTHLRGEITSLKDEEHRRAERLLEQIEEREREREDREAEREARNQRTWRIWFLIGGAMIVAGQQAFEHLPALLSLIAP